MKMHIIGASWNERVTEELIKRGNKPRVIFGTVNDSLSRIRFGWALQLIAVVCDSNWYMLDYASRDML